MLLLLQPEARNRYDWSNRHPKYFWFCRACTLHEIAELELLTVFNPWTREHYLSHWGYLASVRSQSRWVWIDDGKQK